MFQESSISNKENNNEITYNILSETFNDVLGSTLSEVHLHDEELFTHLSISYYNNTLNFNIISIQENLGELSKSIESTPVILSQECLQIIQSQCTNLTVKQLKIMRMGKECQNINSMSYDENEIISPSFAQARTGLLTTRIQSYIVALTLEYEILLLSFNLSRTINQYNISHQIETMRIQKIKFDGNVTQTLLNREREQMIAYVSYETSVKVILIDQIFDQCSMKDIAQFSNDTERIIGEIAVSQELSILRIITRLEKDHRKFFINTYHISQTGNQKGNLKIHFSKKPFHSLLNENKNNNCQLLFSLSSNYLSVQDASNIEVQDFNNHNVKNIIKESSYISKQQTVKNISKNNNQLNHFNINKPQKTMYNLDKSTLIIANSSVNQCISLYNLENPISVLEQISIFPSNQQQPIKRIIVSQSISKIQTPCSANYLSETYDHLKIQKNINTILILVLLDDLSNTIIPILIDKESLDSKLPELKYVSSQITNINVQEDSLSLYNDIDTNFAKTTKNVDIFKTPDRKASFNLNTQSLENYRFPFSSNNQLQNQNEYGNYQFNNYQSQNIQSLVNSIFYQKSSCQGYGLNFDNQNSQEKNEKCLSQESNSSRNLSGYKPSLYQTLWKNNRTLFNENSNSICAEDAAFHSFNKCNLNNEINTFMKYEKNCDKMEEDISPNKEIVEKLIDSQNNNNFTLIQNDQHNFQPSPSFPTKINQQNLIHKNTSNMSRFQGNQFPQDFNSFKIQTEKIMKEDIKLISSIINNKTNQMNDNDIQICVQINHDQQNKSIVDKFPLSLNQQASPLFLTSSPIKNSEVYQYINNNNKINEDINIIKPKFDNTGNNMSKLLSNQININEMEEFSTISCKKSFLKRNNVFNKNNILNTPLLSEKKDSQSNGYSKQKLTDLFLTTSSSQISTIKQFSENNPQKNIFSPSLIQSPNTFNQQFNAVSEIKPFNAQTSTKLFQNSNNKFSHLNNKNNNHIFEKQLFQVDQFSTKQLHFYNEGILQQNKVKQSSKISQDHQTLLLCKRKASPSYHNSSSPSYLIKSDPIKIFHKSD